MPADVLKMIESVAGVVHDVEMVSAGYNSEIAARLHLHNGTLFVKGLRQDHPRVWTQQREADINPFASGLAPELRWQIRKGDGTCWASKTSEDGTPITLPAPLTWNSSFKPCGAWSLPRCQPLSA